MDGVGERLRDCVEGGSTRSASRSPRRLRERIVFTEADHRRVHFRYGEERKLIG